jgi:hypothetical protein
VVLECCSNLLPSENEFLERCSVTKIILLLLTRRDHCPITFHLKCQSVIYQTTRCSIPEERHLHTHHCENFESHHNSQATHCSFFTGDILYMFTFRSIEYKEMKCFRFWSITWFSTHNLHTFLIVLYQPA